MGKIRTVAVVCLFALGAAACSSDSSNKSDAASTTTQATIPEAQLQAKASTVTDLMIAGKWADVVALFNAEMKAKLTADGLKTAWGQVATTYGPYKDRSASARSLTAAPQTFVVFDTPVSFGSEPMKTRITFEATSGQIAVGLFILKASVP